MIQIVHTYLSTEHFTFHASAPPNATYSFAHASSYSVIILKTPHKHCRATDLVDAVLVTVPSVLDNLNPIVVRIKQESNVFHSAISEALLPVATKLFEALASRAEFVNSNT